MMTKLIHFPWAEHAIRVFENGKIFVVIDGKDRFRKTHVDTRGFHYKSVRCTRDFIEKNKRKTNYKGFHVAVAVLSAFKGGRPTPEHKACHKNDDPADNRLDNLYWGTDYDQANDRVRNHGNNKRPKGILINAWLRDALEEHHRVCHERGDGEMPVKYQYLAENIIRDYLNSNWPTWSAWVEQKMKARDSQQT